MKWVIRFFCILVASVANMLISNLIPYLGSDPRNAMVSGLLHGGLAALTLWLFYFQLSKYLICRWEKRSESERKITANILSFLRQYNTPWPIVLILVFALFCGIYQNHTLRQNIQDLEGQIFELQEKPAASVDFDATKDKIESLVDSFESQYNEGKDDGYYDGYIDGYLRGYNEAAKQSDDVDVLDTFSEQRSKIRELREELKGSE